MRLTSPNAAVWGWANHLPSLTNEENWALLGCNLFYTKVDTSNVQEVLRPGNFKMSDLIRSLKINSGQGTGCLGLGDNRWLFIASFIIIKKNLSNQYSLVLQCFTGILFLIIPLFFFFSFGRGEPGFLSFQFKCDFHPYFLKGNSTQGSETERFVLLKQMQWAQDRTSWMLFYKQHRRSD